MQNFIDTATQQPYAFDDDVKVNEIGGVFSFVTAAGVPLNVPATLQPYTIPVPTEAQVAAAQAAAAWSIYQETAQAALAESDKTVLRCYENAVVVPPAWATYRKALRTIIGAASGDPTVALPTKPAYPTGT